MSSTENRVEAIDSRAGIIQFFTKPQFFERLTKPDVLAKPVTLDFPINKTAGIPNTNEVSPRASAPRAGFFFDNGQYFAILGEKCIPFDQLCKHGFLSYEDAGILTYVSKFLGKAAKEAWGEV